MPVRRLLLYAVAGLLRFCSVGDKLASREQLLRGLMGSTAFSDLLNVVKKMMEVGTLLVGSWGRQRKLRGMH